jgi:hypothetical protein
MSDDARRAAVLGVRVEYAACEMARSAADIRDWAAWHVEHGADPKLFAAILRIASDMEWRAQRLHRDIAEKEAAE